MEEIIKTVYQCADFSQVDKIGVICRGVSLSHIGRYKQFFTHSFLVGQHSQSLRKIGHHIKGSKIVLICGSIIFKTDKEMCEKYNIIDLQMGMDPDDSPRKYYKYHKTRKKNRWVKIYPRPKHMRDRNERLDTDQMAYPTSGIYAVDMACLFKPKEVHIIGLDFYYAPYFVREKVQMEENPGRGDRMISFFNALCKVEKDITFHLYTCCKKIQSTDNLKVTFLPF